MGKKPRPQDVPLALYSLVRDYTPSSIRALLAGFFFNISPDIPYDLSRRIKEKNYRKVMTYGFLIGFLFCFMTTASFCFFEGVLFPFQCDLPADQCLSVKFFSRDTVNIIMYAVITPATVAVGLALILATIMTWRQMDNVLNRDRSTLLGWKGFLIIVIILVVSSVAIANYINDAVNVHSEVGAKANELHYWFLGNPSSDRVMRPITVYYTILNYLILVFTLGCIATFVTAIRPILRLSRSIASQSEVLEDASKNILERMSCFADVYLFAKMLLAITMIHSIVWSWSPLALTNNFNIERGFIVFVSIFFIAVPRLHFELEWYRAAELRRQTGKNDIELKPVYIRGFNYYFIWFIDYFVVGSYALSLTGILDWGKYAG